MEKQKTHSFSPLEFLEEEQKYINNMIFFLLSVSFCITSKAGTLCKT